jgi:hypothetical protein
VALKEKLHAHPEKLDEQPRYKDPIMLFRYVEAREFEVEPAYKMVENDYYWRIDFDANNALRNWKNHRYYEALNNYWPARWIGVDKEGSPVFWERAGSVYPSDLAMEIPVDAITLQRIAFIEEGYVRRAEETQKQGKFHRRSITVMDFAGLGLQHISRITLNLFQKVGSIMEQHYPGTVKKILIINAPSLFSKAYEMVKGYLPDRTQKKITICGPNFLEELKQYISEEYIPSRYGGKHPETLNGGGPFTGVYKADNETTIGARDMFQHTVNITTPSIIAFDFKLAANDINFSIDFTPSSAKSLKEVYPSRKVVATDGPLHDEIHAKEVGTYVFKWDNTYSC